MKFGVRDLETRYINNNEIYFKNGFHTWEFIECNEKKIYKSTYIEI